MCTKWVCFYSEAAKEDEEQKFLWNGGGLKSSSIHSIPPFRLPDPSPVMRRYTQMSQQQSCRYHFTCFECDVFMVILQYGWVTQVSTVGREYLMQTSLLPHWCSTFLFIIWFSLSLPHRYLCDSFPQLAKLSCISSVYRIATCLPILSGSGKEEEQNVKEQ